jgi:ElaB/YqjD/DUF883 family membrane-anchored ribosome-binding protein
MASLTETVTAKANEIGAKASEQMGKSMENIRSAAGNVIEQVKDVGSSTLSSVEAKAGEAAGAISGGLKATARSIRENGPQDGHLGSANSAVAQTFSNSANFLDNGGLQGLVDDLSGFIGNNPVPAVLVGVGIGYLIGYASKK